MFLIDYTHYGIQIMRRGRQNINFFFLKRNLKLPSYDSSTEFNVIFYYIYSMIFHAIVYIIQSDSLNMVTLLFRLTINIFKFWFLEYLNTLKDHILKFLWFFRTLLKRLKSILWRHKLYFSYDRPEGHLNWEVGIFYCQLFGV